MTTCPQCNSPLNLDTNKDLCWNCGAVVLKNAPALSEFEMQKDVPVSDESSIGGQQTEPFDPPSAIDRSNSVCLRDNCDVSQGERIELFRAEKISSPEFHRVVLKNNRELPLTNVIGRSDLDPKECLLIKSHESRHIDVPKSATELILSATIGNGRTCFCWSLVEDTSKHAAVVVEHAADHEGNIVVDFEGETPPEIVIKNAATIKGEIRVTHRQKETNTPLLFPLVSEEHSESYPEWAFDEKFRKILLFADSELTIGRSPECRWRVFCRERGGQGIVVKDKYGAELVISENELDCKSVSFPVSRVHATLRWDGNSKIDILDGAGGRHSRRGVFCNGIRIDDGWNRHDLPQIITLGKPDSPLNVGVEIGNVTTPTGARALCLHQLDSPTHELVIWQKQALPFGLAEKASSHWYPTWSDLETQLCIQHDGTFWKVLKAPRISDTGLVRKGQILHCSQRSAYKIARVTNDLLELEKE